MRNVKWVAIVIGGLCGALAPTWATGSPVDTIYESAVLGDRQYQYSRWFNGIFDEVIKPQFSDAERRILANVPLDFPENRPGMEPLGFVCDGEKVYLSVASLKMVNDLILAYAWLGHNHYSLDTINDYMRMLHHWKEQKPPPEPLKALGIPDNARDDAGTNRLATLFTRNVYTFILLHELGHFYHKDPPSWKGIPFEKAQLQEAAADSFALELVGRIGTVPTGIAQYFTWASAYMPNPVDPDYEAALQIQTHPLATQRLAKVADDVDRNSANYAIVPSPETLAEFRELAAEEHKLAELLSASDIQQLIWRRAEMLEPRDLAPRRRNEIIGRPIGSRVGNGPFDGKLAGTAGSLNVEVFLENQSGRVTGTLGMGPELVRIDGIVEEDTLSFTWKSADSDGTGELRRHGETYEGTASLWSTKDGSVWTLREVQPEDAPK
jgi:hypothetical protein